MYNLRLHFTLTGVFSFPYITPLIRIGHPQSCISMESSWNYLNDGKKICLKILECKRINASIIIQAVYFTSRGQWGCQFQFQPFLVCWWVSAPFAHLAILNCTRHKFAAGIWRKIPICSVQNCPDWLIKNKWSGISKFHRMVYIFGYYFMDLPNLTAWG